jgi:hypothetical protein
MPFCAKCGTEVPENTNFCPNCGNPSQSEQNSIAKASTAAFKKVSDKATQLLNSPKVSAKRIPPFAAGGGAIVIIVLLFFACGDSKYVKMVKKGSMALCSDYTVEELANNFMGNPKWGHINHNGNDYVSVSGDIMYNGKPANGLLQLWVKNGVFGYQAFEIDGVPQNEFTAQNLLYGMCARAAGNAAAKNSAAKKQEDVKERIERMKKEAEEKTEKAKKGK